MIRVFHFVLKQKMKDRIVDLAYELNSSISKTVNFILNVTKPALKKYHYEYNEDKVTYVQFGADADIHLYIEENEYRKLRQVHSTMHTYSMAIIIRALIEIFFFGVDKYGFEGFMKYLKTFEESYLNEFYKRKKWLKKCIREQMLYKKNLNPFYKLIFNENCTLIGFEMLC